MSIMSRVAIYLVISARFPIAAVFGRALKMISLLRCFTNYSKEKTIMMRWRLITVHVLFTDHKKSTTSKKKTTTNINEVVYRNGSVGRT